MATMRQPTTRDIEALLSFLPKLYAEGFTPIRRVHNVDQDGETVAFPWAEYDDIVRDFVDAARRECWLDYDYVPEEVERLIESEGGDCGGHTAAATGHADLFRAGREVL